MNEGTVFEALMTDKGFEVKDEVEQAYRQGYEAGLAQIEEKHWNECRQISEYDRELREAKRLLGELLKVVNENKCRNECSSCKNYHKDRCETYDRYEWGHADEVLRLIGGGENS